MEVLTVILLWIAEIWLIYGLTFGMHFKGYYYIIKDWIMKKRNGNNV